LWQPDCKPNSSDLLLVNCRCCGI